MQKVKKNYKKASSLWARIHRYKYFYLMLIPGIVYLFIFRYIPIFGLQTAFRNYHPAMGIEGFFTAEWIGLKNFTVFFNSIYSKRVIINTVVISLLKLLLVFPAPILLALFINDINTRWFKNTIQTITYLPHFLSWVVVGSIMFELFSMSTGSVNIWLQNHFNVRIDFLSSSDSFRSMLILSDIWKDVGWGSIIYLAALSGIDPAQYEAAIIDGARPIQRLVYISLPGIAETIIVMLLLKIGNILDAGFEQVLILYSPSVYDVGDIIDTYVYREGLTNSRYGLATAVGMIKSVIGLILIVGANRLIKKFGYTALF